MSTNVPGRRRLSPVAWIRQPLPINKVLWLLLSVMWAVPAFAQVDTAWVRRYDGPDSSNDSAFAVLVDSSGNTYITGSSHGMGTYWDYATIKYYPNGDTAWVRRYDGPAHQGRDGPTALAIDGLGNVYVTGYSRDSLTYYDCATIKYDTDGNELWVARYDGPASGSDCAYDVAIDGSGNIYVAGHSYYDYVTIKYHPDGDTAWVRTYDGPLGSHDYARAMAIAGDGCVYVTGISADSCDERCSYQGWCYSLATIKYYPDGDTAWVRRYNSCLSLPAYYDIMDLAVDGVGNVYVAGTAVGAEADTGLDFVTIKYHSNGDTAWIRFYDGEIRGFRDYDEFRAVAVDEDGNVYVTGVSTEPLYHSKEYATVRYYASGDTAWVRHYNGRPGCDDGPRAIAIDDHGNVYVTGGSVTALVGPHENFDYATVKYDSLGNQIWVATYNGTETWWWDAAQDLAVDASGNVYVTGWSFGSMSWVDYATIKYAQDMEPPTFTVGVLQNPIFTADLNIYTIASENLKTDPTITIATDTLAVDEVYYDATTIYSSSYRLTTSGDIEIKVAGVDLAQNEGTQIDTFAAGNILPSGGNVVSHDKILLLEIPSGAVIKEEYFLIFRENGQGTKITELESHIGAQQGLQPSVSWDKSDQDIISQPYSITPPEFNLKSQAKLSFDCMSFDLQERDLSRLAVHRLEGEVWTPMPSYLDAGRRQVVAFVDQLGIYQLRYAKLQDQSLLPTAHTLKNNYPNPFNNTTNIRYEISSAGWVKIDVYNTLGQRVRTLVDEHMPSGRYIVDWDGTNDRNHAVSSGIYFSTLKINDFTETKKMVLLK